MTKIASRRPGVLLDTMVAMVPTAALETMMQTPRPPCSVPHRPGPGERRALRPVRPRAARTPVSSRPPPRSTPSRRPPVSTAACRTPSWPAACRLPADGDLAG
ncbi:MAG: hypothetical protein ABSB59_09490 [Streptosporangiaceae bacterium]